MSSSNNLTIYCIYNAEGSLIGEFKYLLKKYFYGFKCSMCQISHNSLTKKKDWDYKLSKLNRNVKTVHLDEQPNDLSQISNGKAPCVIGKDHDGFKFIVTNQDLEKFNGDIDLFFEALVQKTEKLFLN